MTGASVFVGHFFTGENPTYQTITSDAYELLESVESTTDVGQSTAANRPAWNEDALSNGWDAGTFDGTNDVLTSGTVGLTMGDNYATAVVNPTRLGSGGQTGHIWAYGRSTALQPSYRLIYIASTNRYQFVKTDNSDISRINLQADASASGWDLIFIRDAGPSNGATLEVYNVDTATVASYTDGTTSLDRWAVGGINRFGSVDTYYKGQIGGAIHMIEGASEAQRTAVRDWYIANFAGAL